MLYSCVAQIQVKVQHRYLFNGYSFLDLIAGCYLIKNHCAYLKLTNKGK